MGAATRSADHVFTISPEAWRGIAYALDLSRREVEVLQAVVGDQQNKEIAVTPGLSQDTIRTYMKRIRSKLGASSRVRLVERVVVEYLAWVASTAPLKPSPALATCGLRACSQSSVDFVWLATEMPRPSPVCRGTDDLVADRGLTGLSPILPAADRATVHCEGIRRLDREV